MDVNDSGWIDNIQFQNYFTNVIKHWSSLINKQVKLNKPMIQAIFNKIDTDQDGRVYCK